MTGARETFMQRMVALGVALTFIKRSCPEKFGGCIRAINTAIDLIDNLRALPRWKRWVLNRTLK